MNERCLISNGSRKRGTIRPPIAFSPRVVAPPERGVQNWGVQTLEELLLPLLDAAFGTSLRLTGNSADAEDLVQEAALLALRGFGQFEPGTNFRAWFFRILANAFYSRYRRRRREGETIELEDAPELFLYEQTGSLGLHQAGSDPASLLLRHLDEAAIEAAIARLPEEHRMVATLYFMQDFGYQEIADVLDVPVGTVRSRLHRGRRMLQRALWGIAVDRGIVAGLAPGDRDG